MNYYRANFNEVPDADYDSSNSKTILSIKIQKVSYICWNIHFAI